MDSEIEEVEETVETTEVYNKLLNLGIQSKLQEIEDSNGDIELYDLLSQTAAKLWPVSMLQEFELRKVPEEFVKYISRRHQETT